MILSPSICTAGYENTAEVIGWIAERGCDRIHIDVMDGSFVRPIMGGTDFVNMIRALSPLPLELHFMCREPEKMLDIYNVRPGELIYVHADSTYHPHRLLQSLKERGCIPGLAVSFYEDIEDVEELLPHAEAILLMGVKAGCPGSEFYWSVLDKCAEIKKRAAALGLDIPVQVDGSVSPENIEALVKGGIDAVVLGYPGCFDPVRGREATLALMKEIINKTENT